jgi:ketosteroid isomerase-like protein
MVSSDITTLDFDDHSPYNSLPREAKKPKEAINFYVSVFNVSLEAARILRSSALRKVGLPALGYNLVIGYTGLSVFGALSPTGRSGPTPRRRDVNAILALLSPDVEWSEPENPFNPAAGTRHGQAGFLEWLRIGNESEEILKLEPRQFLSDVESVAVVGYSKCRARAAGEAFRSQ